MKDMDPGNAHCPGQDKEVVMIVTREIRDKGALEIQHGKYETGRFDTSARKQAIWETMFEEEHKKH